MSETPKCPECYSQYVYEDRGRYVCPECGFEWSPQGSVEHEVEETVFDANGKPLAEGDTVTVIKDLKVKGSSSVVKVGTKVKNIHLDAASDHNIDCRIDGIGAMKLKSEFVKKA
jgi:protein PhnA